mgnify:CR=1 FL=1
MKKLLKLLHYLSKEDYQIVENAHTVAKFSHEGQFRRSGEHYINHPVAVATLLAELELGAEILAAALLHDVVEDTKISKEDLSDQGFSHSIISLVDGVTKIDKLEFKNLADAQAYNLQKLVMAMAKDARVIVIKLADRLHNLSTISSLNPEKQQRIAKESQQIFIPIAGKLGVNVFKVEMERLCMKILFPWRYHCIEHAIKKNLLCNQHKINTLTNDFLVELNKNSIRVCVLHQEHRAFDIYIEGLIISENSPKDALKISSFYLVTENQNDCYRVLGLAHNYFRYLPGKFKDYIAQPKANGYQAIHKKLMTEQGDVINLHILTQPMLDKANFGIVSYWRQGCSVNKNIEGWFQSLLASQQHIEDAQQFVHFFRSELSETDVYALTPTGQVIALPKGASLIDFAYAVHSELGQSVIGGKINHQWVDNHYIVKMGDVIEVISDDNESPSCLWLQWCKTATAINQIRSWLNKQSEPQAVALGRKVLLNYLGLKEENDIFISACRQNLKNNELESSDYNALYIIIGYARANFLGLLNKIAMDFSEQSNPGMEKESEQAYGLAACCFPLPKDKAVKILTSKGVIVHRHRCKNTHKIQRIPFDWDDFSCIYGNWDKEGEYDAGLYLQLKNQQGALAAVTTTISTLHSSIRDITTQLREKDALVKIVLTTKDRIHLSQIIKALNQSAYVISIRRV